MHNVCLYTNLYKFYQCKIEMLFYIIIVHTYNNDYNILSYIFLNPSSEALERFYYILYTLLHCICSVVLYYMIIP